MRTHLAPWALQNFLVQNNFGGSFGGPIFHNKTFFFLNYEGFRHSQPIP